MDEIMFDHVFYDFEDFEFGCSEGVNDFHFESFQRRGEDVSEASVWEEATNGVIVAPELVYEKHTFCIVLRYRIEA